MKEIQEYRYVFAPNIVETGNPNHPIIHCTDGIINPSFPEDPKFKSIHDFYTNKVLYVQEFKFGINYNPMKKLKKLFNTL